LSTKCEQLEWRRSKVTESRGIGLIYAEIALELQVLRTSVASDVQYLREQAKGTIKEYVTEHISAIPGMSLRIRYYTQTRI